MKSDFYLTFFFTCVHSDIEFENINGSLKPEKILKENEVAHGFDDKMKFLLKLK